MQHATPDFQSLSCSCPAAQHTAAHAVGCFKLPYRHAMTLAITAPGELRIAHGQVWVTFANAALDASSRAGDHFLQPGEVLRLACGQKVVMETLDARPDAAAYFSWAPDAALISGLAVSTSQTPRAEIRQPLLELGAALHQAGRAFGRLVQGLGRNLACTLMVRRSAP